MVCSKCGTRMQILFYSWFCPKDCDRPSTSTSTGWQKHPSDDKWLYQLVRAGEVVPPDTTHGRWVILRADGSPMVPIFSVTTENPGQVVILREQCVTLNDRLLVALKAAERSEDGPVPF